MSKPFQGTYNLSTAMFAMPDESDFMDECEFAVPLCAKEHTAGIHIAYYSDGLLYSPTQTFVCPAVDDTEEQLAFYQGNFRSTIIEMARKKRKLPIIEVAGKKPLWRFFILNYGGARSKQFQQQVHQQWLNNQNRAKLFRDYNGVCCESKDFISILECLSLKHDMSLFIHLQIDLQNFKLKDYKIRSTDELMVDECAILSILSHRQILKSNDGETTTKRRKMDMDLYVNGFLNSMETARMGTILCWCNDIIPHCVHKVNNKQNAEYKLYCGVHSNAVCQYPCTNNSNTRIQAILFVLFDTWCLIVWLSTN